MRFLVACPECCRQFDATERAVGSTFPCSCGAAVTVPQPRAHDAAVVRCSACGGPREGEEPSCRFCGSAFTLHDQDLDTICPGCMARVSGRARFCHFCATPLLGAQAAAGQSGYRCPACEGSRPLASRRLGRVNVALFECGGCGGWWIEKEIFEALADRARSGKLPEGFGEAAAAETSSVNPSLRYRPCATCGALMNRRNYGRRSGVIVDVCARHGIWFDLHELDRLLRWIHEGGEARAERLQREAERIEDRQQFLAEGLRSWNQPERPRSFVALGEALLDLIGAGIHRLFD
jgi:Zn-finger nucleic acid-binding protein